MNRQPVSVIIPTICGENYLLKSLPILKQLAQEVIVVNSGQREEIRSVCAQSEVMCVEPYKHSTFAEANNIGRMFASQLHLLFLNDDVIIEREDFIEKMMSLMLSDDRIGIVGLVLLHPDRSIHHAGIGFDKSLIGDDGVRGRFIYEITAPQGDRIDTKEVEAVTGACLLISFPLFDSIGGWNEEYRNGWEDNDLNCLVREKGLKVILCASSFLIHVQSQTPGRHDYEYQNASLFLQRWVFTGRLKKLLSL